MYLTYEKQLDRARVALNNVSSYPDLAQNMAEYGFGPERIQEGRALLKEAEDASTDYERERGEQLAATARLEAAMEACDAVYSHHLKLARHAFRNEDGLLHALGARGRRSKSYSGWIEQVRTFYKTALTDANVLAGFARYNYGPEELQEGADLLQKVYAANEGQENEKGETQLASQHRIRAFEALDTFMDDFEGLVAVVFADDPQQAERLGIHVPNR